MAGKILIVDDREPLRRRIRALLEQEGLQICGEAVNGLDAIEKVKSLAPDLVILNISMPVMGGIEALPQIVAGRPELKVLIFTVDDSEELKQHVLRLGAHGCVSKSAPPQTLVAEVRRLFSQGMHAD